MPRHFDVTPISKKGRFGKSEPYLKFLIIIYLQNITLIFMLFIIYGFLIYFKNLNLIYKFRIKD